MYILHVLSIKLRDKLYFSFSISTPGFLHFYYMLGANLGSLLYGEVFEMYLEYILTIYWSFADHFFSFFYGVNDKRINVYFCNFKY